MLLVLNYPSRLTQELEMITTLLRLRLSRMTHHRLSYLLRPLYVYLHSNFLLIHHSTSPHCGRLLTGYLLGRYREHLSHLHYYYSYLLKLPPLAHPCLHLHWSILPLLTCFLIHPLLTCFLIDPLLTCFLTPPLLTRFLIILLLIFFLIHPLLTCFLIHPLQTHLLIHPLVACFLIHTL